MATKYYIAKNISFLDLGDENKVSSPHVICIYNSATKLYFRRPISLVFILWRRNMLFIAQYGFFFLRFRRQIFFFFFLSPNVCLFIRFWRRKPNFVAQCNLYLQFRDKTQFSSPNITCIYNLATKLNFRRPM